MYYKKVVLEHNNSKKEEKQPITTKQSESRHTPKFLLEKKVTIMKITILVYIGIYSVR